MTDRDPAAATSGESPTPPPLPDGVTLLSAVPDGAALDGFFVGWPNPPAPATHRRMLDAAYRVSVAVHEGRVIGFANAVSDGVLSAYIPLLEVLPEWQGRGLGRALVQHLSAQLEHLYMVDLCCDEELTGFYESLGFHPARGMLSRNYAAQRGHGAGSD